MIIDQLFDLLDMGIVVLDEDLIVHKWNTWMELHSNIPANQIIGRPIFEYFPHLDNPVFLRSLKYVKNFGNYYFFSQKLHHYLFPFKPVSSLAVNIDYMQQSCTMGQIVDKLTSKKYLYITVHDVTEIAVYEKTLIEMNTKDNLTGVFNRKAFDDQLQNEFKRFTRVSRAFSLMMIDIDYFKKVNDTYGHLCGDHVLKAFASQVASKIRSTDMLARYGGEEFLCLLPETDLENAFHLAEMLRSSIEETDFAFNDINVRITVSVGVTTMCVGIDSSEVLFKKADEALYEAKRTGRNRVVAIQ
ncbi:MAG TPA: sensor domain-containing diguanylate cyclase [Syntrophorhabdaceae bacterium]|nr:sensor domain-containing diguanylate cyclase [Syntrophorhabdaceae bacterium]